VNHDKDHIHLLVSIPPNDVGRERSGNHKTEYGARFEAKIPVLEGKYIGERMQYGQKVISCQLLE